MWRSLEILVRSVFWLWIILTCLTTIFIAITSIGDLPNMLTMMAITLVIEIIIAYGLKWGEGYSGRQRTAGAEMEAA